jgi:hypothetical protein
MITGSKSNKRQRVSRGVKGNWCSSANGTGRLRIWPPLKIGWTGNYAPCQRRKARRARVDRWAARLGPYRVCFATLLVLLRAVVSRSPSLSRLAGAVVLRFSNFEGATAVPTHKRKRSRGASKVASQTRAERSRRGSGGAGSQLMVARWRSITAMRAFRILRDTAYFLGRCSFYNGQRI